MSNPFEITAPQVADIELHDAVPSPFDASGEDDAEALLHAEINGRRAAAENPTALRLARAL
ncbi:hypothetical protein [Phenylobacterium aquaticum]|jgi:hypothetical protein|uniref:hypothetical protein n=1 Tax=Phenylobacterium aquaticum TaxID=1763816 RepID=UPI001F5D8C9F|nr:hypothetical protein [Phenylobacterium aquaticum]MCI3134718.1 hypothetical protein [Phenylobacterium aquaticum]